MSIISIGYITAAPSCTSCSVISKSRKIQKPSRICVKRRLGFSGESDSRRPISWADSRENRKLMAGLSGVRANRSEEGIQTLEQEAFVEGPSDFDAGGLEATLNTLSKWIMVMVFGAIILLRHDAESLWAAMGAVHNSVLSITLKKILNQERPISAIRSGPGMPSSHAQSIFYTLTFINVSLVERYGINGLTATLSGLFFIIGSYFSWLRVSQQLHTTSQVVVGAIIGSIFSIFWFWSWNNFVLNLFVSYLWVRILVILGAVGFCIGFLLYVFKSWIMNER